MGAVARPGADGMMLKSVKLLLGLLLLPFAAACTLFFVKLLGAYESWRQLDQNALWFIGGFAVWLILYFALPPPVKSYVLAHELTHALWGLLMGAKVSNLRVSERGGSVTLTKSNVWITLAPYFFPFYAVLALLAYLLIELKWDMSVYRPFWFAVFGLTWSFHLTFTVSMIGSHQPDIREHGRLFSYVVIYAINLLTAALIVALPGGTPLADLPALLWAEVARVYGAIRDWAVPQAELLWGMFRERMQ